LRVLLLAPHPFYQERGTPIAVDLLLRGLSRRGLRIDLATFHEGENRLYEGVSTHRIRPPRFVHGVMPGFSWKKLICDVFLFFMALALIIRRRPDVIHAVEESAFMALIFRAVLRIPYIYDMDSLLSGQLVEKKPWLKPLGPFFRWCEGLAIRHALAVVPMCAALARAAERHGAAWVGILTDISLLEGQDDTPDPELPPDPDPAVFRFMYIGNLEPYQGINLLLDAFARAVRRNDALRLIVVGGSDAHVAQYRRLAAEKGLAARVLFAGPRPISRMAALFRTADALVSPRVLGENTPMKIYSYLDSGRPVLATDLPTHTQVLTPVTALLVRPDPDALAEGLLRLAGDPDLCEQLARNARNLVQVKYSRAAYEARLNEIYDYVERHLKP